MLERVAQAAVGDEALELDAHVHEGLGDLRVEPGEHAAAPRSCTALAMRMKWSAVLVSITSMPVMSMMAQRARVETTARRSASVMSALRLASMMPTTGRQRIPSHTSMMGVDSSRMAARCWSIVESLSSSSR